MSLSFRKVVVSALAAAVGLLICPAQAEYVTVVTGGEVTSAADGADAVHTFTNFNEEATLTVSYPVRAQILLVGGGGGGAWRYGGGGGAGGVRYVTQELLPVGTYTVSVGAGGLTSPKDLQAGCNGGDSAIVAANGEDFLRAHGGGGGGGWSYASAQGGSGGGVSAQAKAACYPGEGNVGGSGWKPGNEQVAAGGGGGAGGVGGNGTNVKGDDGYYHAGDGGPAAMYTIYDDTERWYAAGGGGAGTRNTKDIVGGNGGMGGGVMLGGLGASSVTDETLGYAAHGGTDATGYGSGGGGGGGQGSVSTAGKGSPGIVIVRYTRVEDPDPVVTMLPVGAVTTSSVTLRGRVDYAADRATVVLRYGVSADALGLSQPLGDYAPGETFEWTLTGLPTARKVYYLFEVTENGQTVQTDVASAETLGVSSGGEMTSAAGGKDQVHTFRVGTESKTLTLASPVFAQVLIVGGGAGSAGYGGGGGAGGVIFREMLLSPGSYDIVVGAGGTAANGYQNRPGAAGSSSAFGLVAKGGGYGGTAGYAAPDGGGSGGGASYKEPNGPGYGDETQGNDGGKDKSGTGGESAIAGGGGGAGGPGQDSWKDADGLWHGGDGGAPLMSTIYDDTPRYYAAGGGGAGTRSAKNVAGGKGGAGADGVSIGGNGADSVSGSAATAGLDDTGSGAGGGGGQGSSSAGAKGGSGIVIVRYTKPDTPLGGAAAQITDIVRVGTSSLIATGLVVSADAAVPVTLEWGSAADAFTGSRDLGLQSPRVPFEFSTMGLSPGTTYYMRLKTVQNAVTSYSTVRAFTTETIATASIAGAASVVTNGAYEIATFTNGVPGTIVTGGGKFDILVVAGGGAGGGSYGGGGGGGGGVIYRTDELLAAGTYRILVGAGGAKDGSKKGGDGENSSILGLTDLGGGAVGTNELFVAIGGGGGGAYDGGGHGPHFGGSAGAGDYSSFGQSKATYVHGQGNPATGNNAGNQGGGGGGAGSPGKDEVSGTTTGRGGDGGDGRLIDITGDPVYYGAGGGGGGTSWAGGGNQGGYGGLGGGGNGASASGYPVLEPNGRDFVGAGGGGAYDRNQKNGRGGSGVVIVRRYAKDMDDPTPVVSAELLEHGAAYARFAVTLGDAGGRGLFPSADLRLTVGAETVTLATGAATGTRVVYDWTGLAPEEKIAWQAIADNGTAASDPVGGEFTTDAAGGTEPAVALVGEGDLAGGTNHTATIAYDITWAGAGCQRVDLAVEWGPADAGGYEHLTPVGSDRIGSGTCRLTDLPFGTTLKYRLVASNALGAVGHSAEGTISMPEAAYVVSPRPFFCVGFPDGNGTITYSLLQVSLFGGNYIDDEGRSVMFSFTNELTVVSGPGVDLDDDPHTLTLSAPGDYVIRVRLVNQNGDVFDYEYPLTLIATGRRVCGVVTNDGNPAATRQASTDIRAVFKLNTPRDVADSPASMRNLKLDAQTPVRLTAVRTRGTTYDLSVWGSNDDVSYTLVATNNWGSALSASTYDSETCVNKVIPVIGTPGAYRYYRFGRGEETAFDATVALCYVELLSDDLHVETRPPEAWETTAARSPVPGSGVRFPGTLTSPGAPADILVAEADSDFGNDFAAWQANGRVTEALTGVADGADFAASAVLGEGLRSVRVFVRRGGTVVPGPETYLVRGDVTPMTNLQAYVVGSQTDRLKLAYDGAVGAVCQTGSSTDEYYFDLTGNPDAVIAGIRVWPSLQSQPYWWLHGTIRVYGARETGDWSAATEMEGSTAEYPKKSIAKADVPELEWELLGDGTFYPEILRTKQEILFTKSERQLKRYKMLKVVNMTYFFVCELEPIGTRRRTNGFMIFVR